MASVKCVICAERFDDKEALIDHFVEIHNVPRGDAVLKRYANLRFSSTSVDMKASNLKTMIALLKLLKLRAVRYTVERDKIKLKKSKIRSLFNKFLNFQDAGHDQSANTFGDEERLSLVNWFLTYYNIFINNNTASLVQDKNIVSFYTVEERESIKCSRIKVEQKDNLDVDFNDQSKIPHTGSSPYESFCTIIQAMFLNFFSNLNKKENSCQIMFEIATEFVKSNEESEIYEFEEQYNGSTEMYAECDERRVVKEYSALSSGHILNIKRIFNEGLSDISRKVSNSFNVVGSNWSLRRIISMNLNIVYNIKSYSSISRLVKGKISDDSVEFGVTTDRNEQISGDKFVSLFEMCYRQVCVSRDIRIKMDQLMKDQIVDTFEKIPELDDEDWETVQLFAKTHFKTADRMSPPKKISNG